MKTKVNHSGQSQQTQPINEPSAHARKHKATYL